MKYLVTGGKGFIGSHISECLRNEGHQVIVIDDESAAENQVFYEIDGVEYHKLDICDEKTDSLYDGVDFVFHLAARSRIQPSISNPRETFRVNVLGTQRVLENCKNYSVKRLIYSASSSCYGKINRPPFKETMTTDCQTPYSLSKHMGEDLCKLYSRVWNVKTVILRYFNVYGPREPLKGRYAPVIGLFKRQTKENKPHTIVGTGKQRRDFTYIDDVVNASILSIKLDCVYAYGDIFNIGTGKNYSINEISSLIGDEKIQIPTRAGEAFETLADNSKARSLLNWSPKYDLKDVINDY